MSKTFADEVFASPELNQKIDQLVSQVQEGTQKIEGVRTGSAESEADYQALLEKVSAVRGRPLFYPYVGSGLGRGPFVELKDGSVKMDLINGIGVHIMGHSHPGVQRAAVRGALSDVVNLGNLQPNDEYIEIGERLTRLASRQSRMNKVWLSTSGSMANENALKICRQKKSPAKKIIAMKDAFAGRTTMMAEVTDNPAYKQGLPEYNEVLRVPFATTTTLRNCAVACSNGCRVSNESASVITLLKKYLDENPGDIAAFSFEPMLGEGGYKVGCHEFFVPILRFLRENDIPIWADEVQTFMRTGELFAFETLKIGEFIDVCTIAKTAQVGATLYTEDYNPKPGLIAGTFSGSTAALAAGIEILDELVEKGDYFGENGRVKQIHEEFMEMFEGLKSGACKGMLKDAGGLGLMIAVTPFDGAKDTTIKLLHAMYKNGLIAFGCGKVPFRLRFLVPATITKEEIAVAGKILEKSLLEVAEEIHWNS